MKNGTLALTSQMTSPYDQVAGIIAYENGELDDNQVVELFQNLVETGVVWHLQGSYGRTAHSMIKAGLIFPR